MTRSFCGSKCGASIIGCFALVFAAGGCVPAEFGRATAYYVRKAAVTDAAARRTTVSPYYRFDSLLLSDLDDALEKSNEADLRERAVSILRQSNRLARASTENEIERMPTSTRAALAAAAGIDADSDALKRQYGQLADAALERDIASVDGLAAAKLLKKLKSLRSGVEDLPDDQGRVARRALLLWAALPVAIGIADEESRLTDKCIAKADKEFEHIAVWRPTSNDERTLINRFAPVIGVESPRSRDYDADQDKIGAVELSADGGPIQVDIDTAKPTVYAYTSEAKIHGRRHKQLNYVWWFPERPAMTRDDPVAGRIDGAMLRITLDAEDTPMFIESSLNCGCAHEVFVSSALEAAALDAFGSPLAGKRFAIERDVRGKHDVVVIDTFDPGQGAIRPLVLSSAGYHEVCQIRFLTPESINVVKDASYRLRSYDELDRLPLGDGIASMFGPDGLVHNAGRPEGYLLAPSGMLSAGQPRKRGTQRIRWDDYLHDDPHLLEQTLRIPSHD